MKSKRTKVILYTIQKPGHDLIKGYKPLDIYQDPTSPYYPLAQYLKWEQWAWCFTDLKDFFDNNGWLDFESRLNHALWTLRVPYENIVWCSLDSQCEDTQNVKKQIHSDPLFIRMLGEIPMALVKTPIKKEWGFSVETARAVFRRANILTHDKSHANPDRYPRASPVHLCGI